jgi:splicing factor 3B subunit 4
MSTTPGSFNFTGKNQEATCYVGNLDEKANDALVWELFVQVAPVVSLFIPKDRVNQSHYGYGFVELGSEVDAEYASKVLNGIKIFGKAIRVNRASSDRRNLDVGANLFIGNLDPLVDETLLQENFRSFGNVIGAKVAREGEAGSGASRGFGFVSFDSFEASDAAIDAMNGQFLCNRPITVNYAFKKDGKGERHGSAAERLLSAQAQRSGLVSSKPAQMPQMAQIPQGFPQMPQGFPQMPQGFPQMPFPFPGMSFPFPIDPQQMQQQQQQFYYPQPPQQQPPQ